MIKIKYKLDGLDCANCAARLEDKVKKVDGVEDASVSFLSCKMTLEIDEKIQEEIVEKIKKVVKKEEPDVNIKEI